MNASYSLLSSSSTSSFTSTNSVQNKWFIYSKEIQPGKSAVIGGNKLVFYVIHLTAIFVICISLTSCILVITNIYHNYKKSKGHYDLSDRFPLYLAISGACWGVSNLSTDHIILLIHPILPEKYVASALGVNVFMFFGYQQFMSAGLSVFTYLKVVHRLKICLGTMDWKLHLTALIFLLLSVTIYWHLDAFGNSGYVFLVDMSSPWGKLLGINIAMSCTVHAILSFVAYRSIQNVIEAQKGFSVHIIHQPSTTTTNSNHLMTNNNVSTSINNSSKELMTQRDLKHILSYTSTATECLTTFVYITICLYIPFAILGWVVVGFGLFGIIEPITALVVVILANSPGWVNALGYWRNRKIKEKRKLLMQSNCRATMSFNGC